MVIVLSPSHVGSRNANVRRRAFAGLSQGVDTPVKRITENA
jgi:hypothetical protein